ncbi:hypothetical protein KPL40_13290 [Clostridium gasigenes]|uniref:hypothetical protein n=1 Tax=Clostridium gasigenes TaxID=94869 RepID=UPI001C0DCB62|nr:hypothetical protein [Clostridium gasigenes]MBU3133423.1 hypothetical protein [Clostridium gasigenes]
MINDLLYKLLTMILALALSQFIYLKFDQKYCITDKVNLKLKVSKEWKPSFSICLYSSNYITTKYVKRGYSSNSGYNIFYSYWNFYRGVYIYSN